jgi:hypothetical protein
MTRLIHWARINLKNAIKRMVEVKPVTPRKRTEEFQPGDQVLLHRDQAGSTYPQDKLAPLWVGPFTVIRRISRVAYVIAVPPRFQSGPEFHIQYLKSYPDYIDELKTTLPSGSSAPLSRLSFDDIHIINLEYIQDQDEITDLFATTPMGFYTVHELIRRHHYREIAQYLHDHRQHLKLPAQLGKTILKKFHQQTTTFRGILTAYDPNPQHTATAYQVSYEDGDSEWVSVDYIKKSRLKKFPAP